jgi:hypothetical protein
MVKRQLAFDAVEGVPADIAFPDRALGNEGRLAEVDIHPGRPNRALPLSVTISGVFDLGIEAIGLGRGG